MYAAYTSDNQLENHESLEGKRVEKELSAEEIAAREQAAAEWREKVGAEPEAEPDFAAAMADVPEFGVASQEAAVAAAATVGIVDAIAPTEKTIDGTPNADNENQRTALNATERAAEEQIDENNVDVSNLVQDVSSDAPGGKEAILRDADAASTNAEQAQRAADGLSTKIAAGESDGKTESENILNAAMVSAAGASVAAEKAAIEMTTDHPNATIDKSEAEESIEKADSLRDSLDQAAQQVQDPELMAKMQKGASDITAELEKSKDLLGEAERIEAEESEADERQDDSDNLVDQETDDNASIAEMVFGQTAATPNAVNEALLNSAEPIDPNTLANITEKSAEDDDAKKALIDNEEQIKAAAATDENLSKQRAIYG